MFSAEELNRYKRHILLPEVGISGQEKLKQSKVLVIGAGGLGCPVLQYMVAAGVGTIGVVDFDVVDESNLQRQILYTQNSIGKSKVNEAAQKLHVQNPFVSIVGYPTALSRDNALELISGYDVVVDATDNFSTRYLINDACLLADKPFVYGSVYRFQGQVSVFNYIDKSGERGPSYRCLFPSVQNTGINCSDAGVLGVLPGIVGTLQANETLKILLGLEGVLTGRMLLFDALSLKFSEFKIPRNKKNDEFPITIQRFRVMDYGQGCITKIKEQQIEVAQLLSWVKMGKDIQVIDVREWGERPLIDFMKVDKIPLSELSDKYNLIEKNKEVILVCKSGVRSLKALEILKNKGFLNLWSLKGGLHELLTHPFINVEQDYGN